jgi:molybdopterin-guanine dinucleotide biosynthesis protein A
MNELAAVSGIVLAGGRSRRFGSQKLAAEVAGVPLLHHSVRAVAQVCDETLVVGPPGGLPVDLPSGVRSAPSIVLDRDPYEGPLVALVQAAHSAQHERLLLVGGDMPDLQAAVLRRLLKFDHGRDGACLVVDRWVQPFPSGLDRDVTLTRGSELIESGERSLRGFLDALDVELVAEDEWRALDGEARSLHDVDRPEDLRS